MGLEILYLLIPVTFLLAVIALGLFIWAIHSGQYDDLETPAIRVLFDDPLDEERAPQPDTAENGRSGGLAQRRGAEKPRIRSGGV